MTPNTSGRVWFITGSSTGFGRLLAEESLAAGDQMQKEIAEWEPVTLGADFPEGGHAQGGR